MPRMDGWATLAALRQLAPDLPAILASGYDETHVMAGDHPEWPHAFLRKPYQREALSDALRHVLEKGSGAKA
jgi:CheY-like chemotaxis protein